MVEVGVVRSYDLFFHYQTQLGELGLGGVSVGNENWLHLGCISAEFHPNFDGDPKEIRSKLESKVESACQLSKLFEPY